MCNHAYQCRNKEVVYRKEGILCKIKRFILCGTYFMCNNIYTRTFKYRIMTHAINTKFLFVNVYRSVRMLATEY